LTEAAVAWAAFAQEAKSRIDRPDNANLELIQYYVSHGESAGAVALGAGEVRRRPTVAVLTAYSEALWAAGNTEEARRLMDRANAVGKKKT
jgi:hypothetical protein